MDATESPPHPSASPAQTLAGVRTDRVLLQDFRPVAMSLEAELSAQYWQVEGTRPFVENAVPYAVNNSGHGPEAAAQVLLANCLEHPDPGKSIAMLELGAGLGLFARQFLDAFDELCQAGGHDFYARLTYHATDFSPATIEQWQRTGQFEPHAGHVVIARANALRPRDLTAADGKPIILDRLRGVIANYLLDSLPVAVIDRGGAAPTQLCVRTWLSRHPERPPLPHHLSEEQAAALAASPDPEQRLRLLPILPHLEFETAMRAEGMEAIGYLDEAMALPGRGRCIVNHGALSCLDQCLEALDRRGFILINDFGAVSPDLSGSTLQVQRFGMSTASALNFPLIEQHLRARGAQTLSPPGDAERSIHSRLVLPGPAPRTRAAFEQRYGEAAFQQAESLSTMATEYLLAGRLDDTLQLYQRAVARCPRDWHTMALAAEFLCQNLRKFPESLELAQAAATLNPWYSTFVWNTLGNALFCLGRYDEAHEAYLKAEAIDPDDAQTNLNLAYSLSQAGHHRRALSYIARGLAHDRSQRYRTHLLDKQQQVLAALSAQGSAETQLLNQRYTAFTSAR